MDLPHCVIMEFFQIIHNAIFNNHALLFSLERYEA